MTEVLQSSSPSSSSSLSCAPSLRNEEEDENDITAAETADVEVERDRQLSLLALLVELFRKSFWVAASCKDREREGRMEIGWPTNVRHVAHVTFDRFNGFLGLPVELEPEVPRRAPSASATVFGVSTESMQLSFDSRGNSVPTILLLLQNCLYAQGGLEAEGIFRINAENGQEEHVRDQLNHGMLPDGIDVHCLAGLIKAWFRELPTGVLDSLSPEQVMQSQSEEDYSSLVRFLPPTEAALLDWAINLMADVVQQEHLNKMNARNIAMVFAPNMTQMADPLTALVYAVQVMNFLKTLVEKALREREDSVVEPGHISEYSDENGHHSPSQPLLKYISREDDEAEPSFECGEPVLESTSDSNELENSTDGDAQSDSTSIEGSFEDCETRTLVNSIVNGEGGKVIDGNRTRSEERCLRELIGQTSMLNFTKGPRTGQGSVFPVAGQIDKSTECSNLNHINSITNERIEAWR